MILLRTWSGIANHWPQRRQEWTMGCGAMAMGIALIVQPYMFDLAPHYATLRDWADEAIFADLFFFAGAFRLFALVVNGTFAALRFTPHLRVASAVVGAFIWGLFSYSFIHAYGFTAGLGPSIETSLGPAVVYGIAAASEVVNVRTASMDVGAWSKGRV